MKKIILLHSIFFLFINCGKEDLNCTEKKTETTVEVSFGENKRITLPYSLDELFIEFRCFEDTRCKEWSNNHIDSCNYNCGKILVSSDYIMYAYTKKIINNHFFNYLEGCTEFYADKHKVINSDKNIEIYLRSVKPLFLDNDTLFYENYTATYVISQINKICK